jgi:hypothetical protein
MSVNIYDSNTGQLQKIAGLLENENIGVPKAGTYTSDANSNADNIKALDTALVNINQAVSNVADNIADDNDEYNPNHNYVVGEYCISPDDGTLQKCVVATSGGSWATVKDTCFEKDSLTNVVETLNSGLSAKEFVPTYANCRPDQGAITVNAYHVNINLRVVPLSNISQGTDIILLSGLPAPKRRVMLIGGLAGGSLQHAFVTPEGTLNIFAYTNITTSNVIELCGSYDIA